MGKRVISTYGGALYYSQLAMMQNVCDSREDDDSQLKKHDVVVPGIQMRSSRSRGMQRLAEVQDKEMLRIRSPQIELMRELTAVKKVRSLQDPSTLSSFDTLSLDSCVTGVSFRDDAGGMTFGNELSQPLVGKRKTRRSKIRRGVRELSNRQWRLGAGSGARGLSGCRIQQDAYVNGVAMDIGGKDHGKDDAKRKEYRDAGADGGGGGASEPRAAHTWNRKRLEIGDEAQAIADLNGSREGRGNNRCTASSQCGPRAKEESYRHRERMQIDDAENARRLMMSETRLPCHYPHHSYFSELSRAHAHTLRGIRDRVLEEEGDNLFESEEGNRNFVVQESVEVASSRMSNSASPFGRDSVKPAKASKLSSGLKKREGARMKEGLNLTRVCLHVRGRTKSQASSGYGETRTALTTNDEPEVSSIPQKRRGLRWYWSRIRKYRAKRLFAFLRRGFACVFPVGKRIKKENSKRQIARNGSRLTSMRGCEAPASNTTKKSTTRPLHSYLGGVLQQVDRKKTHGNHELVVTSLPQSGASACDLPLESGLKMTRSRRAGESPRAAISTKKLPNDRRGPQEVQGFVAEKEEEEAHQRLSQKYRPKSFKDLVGQTLVVKSLVNAITKGRVAPVYLFSGPQGTGKTSAARIFAAALVCLATEPHRRPCGLCKECAATFTLNMSFHVREVDAANELEIEHVRALLSSMSSSPSHSCYQVFIIERCDFLSAEMWNTFLKFLEEPPPDIVLILITTNPERLPLTATSRCQKFLFGKVKDAEIVSRLQMLAAKENLEVDVAALSLIASRADGSLQDAESTLDQLSLLDKKVSLTIVQELVGHIPDDMLLDLLDLALSGDAVNTVRCTRELLDLGVDALSLVAQLASLITNILGGSFDIQREMRSKGGFFRRDLSSREEQHQLRQALKVLLESEKQLRVSHDQPTWLTAALLQFAPDQSYVPFSVNTSMAPSPIALETLETVTPRDPYTPGPPNFQDTEVHQRQAHYLHPQLPPQMSHLGYCQREEERLQSSTSSEGRTRCIPSVSAQSEAKVHPAHSPLLKSGNSSTEEVPEFSSSLLYDGHQVLARSCDFQLLAHGELEDVWTKVLHSYRSDVLRQLMQAQGSLVSLSVANDNTYAVAHVEFQHPEHKARAERLQSSTCHAFQVALRCPVELNFSLAGLQETVLEDSKEHLQYESIANSWESSSLSSSKHSELKGPISKACAGKSLSKSSDVLGCPLDVKHGSSQNQHLEGPTGQPPVYSGNLDHQGFQSCKAGQKSQSCFESPCISGVPTKLKIGCRLWQQPTGLDTADKIQSQACKVHKPMKHKTLKIKGTSSIEQDKL